MSAPCEGLLLVDKPSGPTSHDVVDRVRRAAGQRRIGHSGTLDPLASGLLPLALGRATRLIRFLPHEPKVYTGTFELGRNTDTDDICGETTRIHGGPLPAAASVAATAASLLGESLQRPPDYSARKVAGRRLYEYARRGQTVESAPMPVRVESFEIQPATARGAGHFDFTVAVSAGTYVRALVRDLGATLGCGGTLAALRRIAIGPLRVEEALPLTEDHDALRAAMQGALVPIDRIPLAPEELPLHDHEAVRRFAHGVAVAAPGANGRLFRVTAADGRLLGIGEHRDGLLHPRVVLPPA